MRIRFVVDQSDPDRWNDSVSHESSKASTVYVNDRHPHETCTFYDVLRENYRKYCRENVNIRTQSVLIDIPDDIMFQFMMEGVHDYDYLVYNLRTKKLVFSANLDEAHNEAYSTDGNNSKSWGTANRNKQDIILDWDVISYNYNIRESKVYVAEGPQYLDVLEYVKPNIQEWANTKYYLIAFDLNTVVTELENERSPELYTSRSCDPVPENYSRENGSNLSIEGLEFLIKEYIEDGEYFLGAKKFITESQIEVLRRIYLDTYHRSTEEV